MKIFLNFDKFLKFFHVYQILQYIWEIFEVFILCASLPNRLNTTNRLRVNYKIFTTNCLLQINCDKMTMVCFDPRRIGMTENAGTGKYRYLGWKMQVLENDGTFVKVENAGTFVYLYIFFLHLFTLIKIFETQYLKPKH